MRSEDLKLEELVEFTEGALNLHGRRLVLHSLHALAQFRKDLVDMVGLDQARRILTRWGYFWGNADAAAMKRIFKWDDPTEWLKAGPRLHTLQGVVKSVVKSLETDKDHFRMEVTWRDSGATNLLRSRQAASSAASRPGARLDPAKRIAASRRPEDTSGGDAQ